MNLLKRWLIHITLPTKKLETAFNINVDSNHTKHVISILTIKPNYSEIAKKCVNKIVKEMSIR